MVVLCSTAQEQSSRWQQLQPALVGLFRRDALLRTDAARQLHETDPALATRQQTSTSAARKVAQDPFSGLLDNGVGANLTTAVVTTAAQSFR